ncbi:hypothetical protein [Spiroplasma endosymbiont of Cantharis rufa]|uniref:hypothetical protein n=1 Tax=Spiroplasma endosymbiont of Cantharis rufa TaxID=3066279 RepID=UPI0030CD1FBF
MESVYDKLEDLINNNQKNNSFKIIAKNIITLFDKGEFITQKEIGELSFVATSTITKFSQSLGYSGYKELLFTLKNEYNKYGNLKVKKDIKAKDILISMIEWIEKNKEFIISLANAIKEAKVIKIYGSYQINLTLQYFNQTLMALNKKSLIINNDYNYFDENFKDSEILNLLIVCGKDNKTLIRDFEQFFDNKQKNYLIVSKIQQSKINLIFNNSLVIDYLNDDSKFIYRNMALNMLFLSIFQEI